MSAQQRVVHIPIQREHLSDAFRLYKNVGEMLEKGYMY